MTSPHSGIDFVAYDREGRVLVLAEAKSRRGTSESWAARLSEKEYALTWDAALV